MTHDRHVFGVTLDQIDQLDRLVRTIAASGDVIAVGSGAPLHGASLPALGEVIFGAANAIRDLLDQVEEQRVDGVPATSVSDATKSPRPISADDMRRRLEHARSLLQTMHAAATRADGPDDMADACRTVSATVEEAIEYFGTDADASPE